MAIKPEKLARLRVLFALRRLSPTVQNDILSDGTVVAVHEIEVAHSVNLPGNVTIDRPRLFEYLQKAADGEPVPEEIACIDGGKLGVQARIEGEAVILAYGVNATRFPAALLLSANPERRRAIGGGLLRQNTLTVANRQAFLDRISKPDFGHDDFFAASMILDASPEAFTSILHQKAESGRLSLSDFLPAQDGYWINLFAARAASSSMLDFAASELHTERAAVFTRNVVSGLETSSLTFAAPELVPRNLAETFDSEKILAAVRHLIPLGDPFALAGAFDFCIDRFKSDIRFVDAGDAILIKLFDDPKRLMRELVPYATAFVIATAHLAGHEVFQREPVYWRRLAAAGHAALVARTLGEAPNDEEDILKWAMGFVGKTYYLSVLNDAGMEPRWRADWIEPRILAADLYGRIIGSKMRVATDELPAPWTERINKATVWITEERAQLAAGFPAIGQGTLSVPAQKAEPGTPVADLYDALLGEPTIKNFLFLTPLVYSFGLQPEARDAALAVVQSLRTGTKPVDLDTVERVLCLATCIAAQTKDTELGDAAAQICIERIAIAEDAGFLLTAAIIMLEAVASHTDRTQGISALAKRLESLAYVGPPVVLEELLEVLQILRTIDRDLGVRLGRAFATARLGRSAAPAA